MRLAHELEALRAWCEPVGRPHAQPLLEHDERSAPGNRKPLDRIRAFGQPSTNDMPANGKPDGHTDPSIAIEVLATRRGGSACGNEGEKEGEDRSESHALTTDVSPREVPSSAATSLT
jgi:hypothetical protein